ncbi:tartronate semialdehyde reductase [Salmonella enterica subsp. enterica]|uniref:Tartronate semialdehyde reductase n=1 Tax=Salmonella enterica I TaxID=59201 RepID=A0A447TUZ8_SALET|nr:tartronate semialdehyde reductase [Salmonella enterica subsp. enterica]
MIDMSSIAPLASREISDALKAKGVEMLDAPVSGGEPKAIDGTLSVMVGGDKAIFDKYYDLMKAMAGSVVHTGDIGAGNVTKLANQVIVALNIAAMSEALTLATKAGVNPDLVYQAIRGGLAGSTVLGCEKRRWSWTETLSQVSVSICTLKIWRMRWIPPTALARSSR